MVKTISEQWVAQVVDEVTASFETRQVPWLRELVEQPSATHELEDVERAVQFVDALAESLGLVRTIGQRRDAACALPRLYAPPHVASNGVLALVGHVDTVFPRRLGFSKCERDADTLYGPGVHDMKSGLSVMLFALRAISRVLPDLFDALSFCVVCNTDEEAGSPGTCAWLQSLAPALSAALVFEPGRLGDQLVTRRKGGFVYRIDVRGRATHAGNNHEQGVNAIHALALLIDKLESYTDYGRGVSINTGLAGGGVSVNTVADHAWCEVDGRFVRPIDGELVSSQVEHLLRVPLPEPLTGVRVSFERRVSRPPMEACQLSDALWAEYELSAARVGFQVGKAPIQGGGSDANVLSAVGVPCLDCLGPLGGNSHTRDEFCLLPSLLQRTQALAVLLALRALSHR